MGLISESENFHTRQHPSSCGTLTTGCDLLRLAGCRVLAFTCRDDPFQRSQGKWIWSHMNFKGPWSPPTLPGSKPVHSESYLQDPRNSGWNKNEPVPETIHQDMGGWCSRPENSEFPILFNPHHPTLQPLPSTNCNNIHRSPTIPNHPQPSPTLISPNPPSPPSHLPHRPQITFSLGVFELLRGSRRLASISSSFAPGASAARRYSARVVPKGDGHVGLRRPQVRAASPT